MVVEGTEDSSELRDVMNSPVTRSLLVFVVVSLVVSAGCTFGNTEDSNGASAMSDSSGPDTPDVAIEPASPSFELSDEEWRERLTDEEYQILRDEGTEPAFSGELLDNEREGTYQCAGCGHDLFSSETKFESGTGWPSFTAPIDEEDAIGTAEDWKTGRMRIEVHCGRCAGHLGHVFTDGPEPTGLRYCINSLALDFEEAE